MSPSPPETALPAKEYVTIVSTQTPLDGTSDGRDDAAEGVVVDIVGPCALKTCKGLIGLDV